MAQEEEDMMARRSSLFGLLAFVLHQASLRRGQQYLTHKTEQVATTNAVHQQASRSQILSHNMDTTARRQNDNVKQ
jgi:hypothetical protein